MPSTSWLKPREAKAQAVLPDHKRMIAPMHYPALTYSVNSDRDYERGNRPAMRARANSAASLESNSRYSVGSHRSFHRRPPSIRVPSNLTIRRSERLAVAFVSLEDEEALELARPILDLVDVVGDYLDGPHSEAGAGRIAIGEILDVDRLIKFSQDDAENAEKARIHAQKRKKKRAILGLRKAETEHPVFGAELRATYNYASVWMLLGTKPCKVPLVLIASIEQLYHRGMHTPNLFAPDPKEFSPAVIGLMDTFCNSYNYGDEVDSPIARASIADICHLLRYFLGSLPHAPLHSALFRAITDLCVIPSSIERRRREEAGEDELTEAEMLEDEEYRIVMAKLLLRLLPPAHFGTFVYTIAFLAQLPICSAANLTIEQLGDMFGHLVCGPRNALEYLEHEQAFPADLDFKMDLHKLEGDAKTYVEGLAGDTVMWMIRHWDHISNGLMMDDYQEDVESFQDLVAEKLAEAHGENQRPAKASSVPMARQAPAVPRRLMSEDEESVYVEEDVPSGMLSGDDAGDEGDGDDICPAPSKHRGSAQTDTTFVGEPQSLSSLDKGKGKAKMVDTEDSAVWGTIDAGKRTPTIEYSSMFAPEQQALVDDIQGHLGFAPQEPVQVRRVVIEEPKEYDSYRKQMVPALKRKPTGYRAPPKGVAFEEDISPLSTPGAALDQSDPFDAEPTREYAPSTTSTSPEWLEDALQARETLVVQQASHIACLEKKARTTETELRDAKTTAEMSKRQAADAMEKYNKLREQLEKMLTIGRDM